MDMLLCFLKIDYNVAHLFGELNMPANDVVRARIDKHIKEEATVVAMREARRGGLTSFATVDELMADLNARN
jgi:hypothetical protein